MSSSLLLDVACYPECFGAALAAEKYFGVFAKIAGLFGIIFYYNGAGRIGQNRLEAPSSTCAAAGSAHIVNGNGLVADVSERKSIANGLAQSNIAEFVLGIAKPADFILRREDGQKRYANKQQYLRKHGQVVLGYNGSAEACIAL